MSPDFGVVASGPGDRPVAPVEASILPRTRSLTRTIGSLTVVNGTIVMTMVVTGPLQARALGPSGRGTLAAILVPLMFAPVLTTLGLASWATVQVARGAAVNRVAGTGCWLAFLFGLGCALLGIPISAAIAHGRSTVRTFLEIGFFLMPLVSPGSVLLWMLIGLQRWRMVAVAILIQPVSTLLGIVVLYHQHALTVERVAILTLAGMLATLLPELTALRGAGWPVFERARARAAMVFGLRSWLGQLGSLTNNRIDQVMMAALVPSRQLGLYVVAATLAYIPQSLIVGAITPPLLTSVAAGERWLVARAMRLTIGVMVVVCLTLGAVTPILLPLLFGPHFQAAVPLAWVLLAASAPLIAVAVLATALTGDGQPQVPAGCEAVTVVITLIGLFALLGPLGAMGAAITSLVAYSTNFVLQLHVAHRRFGGPLRQYLLLHAADLRWASQQLARRQ